jgi:hypothetical protein
VAGFLSGKRIRYKIESTKRNFQGLTIFWLPVTIVDVIR